MARYIDADTLIEAIKNELWDWQALDDITATTVLKQTITDIQNAPTADVVERKKAKLLNANPVGECSDCGWLIDYRDGFNYCPNCGAQMDERRDDAET